MYFEEYGYHDRIVVEILKTLKSFGLKHRLKKSFLKTGLMEDHKQKEVHIFGQPLHALPKEEVRLPQGKDPVCVPEFLIKACSYIENGVTMEGLFRKAGSAARQKEIKALIDRGGQLDSSVHHVIDVANVLKSFLRELAEPLIPFKYHDTLLRCMLLKERRDEAVILTCLLLPAEHLNSLAYLMTFLHSVASHSELNKMTISNLAIIIAPSIMPVASPKMTPQGNQVVNHHVQICQILIKNANLIGVVPEHILSGELSFSNSSTHNSYSNDRSSKKKKKRRSGSLTRVFNGLKKMVSGRATPDFDSSTTPDKEMHTPCIMSTGKKRKATDAMSAPLSSKKKKELMQSLPQGSVLGDTPYKTYIDHRNDKLTPRILVATQKPEKNKTPPQKIKRRFFSKGNTDGATQKSSKTLSGSSLKVSRISLLARSTRKKKDKEESMTSNDSSSMVATVDSMEEVPSLHVDSFQKMPQSSEEYVRVPKSEYEEIKDRVSKIESRLSHEFENIVGVSMSDTELTPNSSSTSPKRLSNTDRVQNVYKKTLRESDRLNNSSTEELAKLLSQELNIRRNSENKIIRSPSARKIGSIRRRSRENCNSDSCSASNNGGACSLIFNPSKSLRRGKPNTVCTGLPPPHFKGGNVCIHNFSTHSSSLEPDNDKEQFGILTRSQAQRASSFHGLSQQQQRMNNLYKSNNNIPNINDDNNIDWKPGQTYLENVKPDENESDNKRESIAKLRCQNAGMVLAKAKLFDNLGDSNLLTRQQKLTRAVSSRPFRHNSSKNRSSVRRKHSDRKVTENALKLNSLEFKNSPGNTMKNFGKYINNEPSVLQRQKFNSGKENVFKSDKPTQTNDICNNAVISPLKDVNRTPNIKRSLTINLTPQFRRTPKDSNIISIRNTPMKSINHIGTARRSPRLLLKYKNTPNIINYK